MAGSEDEIAAYLAAGVDGFFTDFPDIGVAARNRARAERGQVMRKVLVLIGGVAAAVGRLRRQDGV